MKNTDIKYVEVNYLAPAIEVVAVNIEAGLNTSAPAKLDPVEW